MQVGKRTKLDSPCAALQRTCTNKLFMLGLFPGASVAPAEQKQPMHTGATAQSASLLTSMSLILLSLLAFVTGILHIRAEYRGPRRAVYLLKPLTTVLLLCLALLTAQPVSPFYKGAISLGLLFSLAGDIFLMLPADRFIAGLVSFLLAHLAYIIAFTSQSGFHVWSANAAPWLVYGIVILGFLWPHLDKLKAPVLVYMAVILLMGIQAAEQWRQVEQTRALLALIGAILFIISDSALALDRFRKPFPSARALVLGAYYVAQWLIARSIG
ncbi:MAG: lysoplasmalogenase [Caldilineaceae bacterium]